MVALALPAIASDAPPSAPQRTAESRTDNTTLEEFLRRVVGDFDGADGQWTFQYDGVAMTLLADEQHDRMRIVARVVEARELKPGDLLVLLEANFDRALDARYAVWRGSVWSTYIHPLGSLSKKKLISAVRQVASLHSTYGTTYTSTDIYLGQGQ